MYDFARAELAVGTLLDTAQSIFEAMRSGAAAENSGEALAARVQALQSDFDTHLAVVTEAAAALGQQQQQARDGGPSNGGSGGADETPELAALREERRALRQQLDARNAELKAQLDQLRQLLCDVRLMNG